MYTNVQNYTTERKHINNKWTFRGRTPEWRTTWTTSESRTSISNEARQPSFTRLQIFSTTWRLLIPVFSPPSHSLYLTLTETHTVSTSFLLNLKSSQGISMLPSFNFHFLSLAFTQPNIGPTYASQPHNGFESTQSLDEINSSKRLA